MDSTALQTTDELVKMLQKFGARFLIDIFFMLILMRFVYYKFYKRSDLFFTFFIFNIVIFLISFLLNKVELSMGAAFGLFAVFSMLRYRTEDISIKDMSYLFLVIAIGLVAAVTKIKDTTIVILSAYLFESSLLFKKENVQLIIYEKIELIKANATDELLLDLRERTGLNIHRISISKIDFLKDSAQIKVYYYDEN